MNSSKSKRQNLQNRLKENAEEMMELKVKKSTLILSEAYKFHCIMMKMKREEVDVSIYHERISKKLSMLKNKYNS